MAEELNLRAFIKRIIEGVGDVAENATGFVNAVAERVGQKASPYPAPPIR